MGNTLSADKNARKAKRRHEARVRVKSELKTLRKKTLKAIEARKPATEVAAALQEAVSKFDKAASNKYIHHRTAARKISRLMRAVHKAQVAAAAK